MWNNRLNSRTVIRKPLPLNMEPLHDLFLGEQIIAAIGRVNTRNGRFRTNVGMFRIRLK